MQTMVLIGKDLSENIALAQLAMKWFDSQENGLFTLNYAFKKHPELGEEFVQCIGNFTGGGEQMTWAYMGTLS